MAEQIHDKYGKELIREIVGNRFISGGDAVKVKYGEISASIDGVIEGCCAIEIESRVDKQIRGALLDLIEHHYPKKLLILIPAHMNDPEKTANHCEYIFKKYKKGGEILKVVLLEGTGEHPKMEEDKEKIKKALNELGCL